MSLCHVRFLEGVCSISHLSCDIGSVCGMRVGALISAISIRVNSYEILYHISKALFSVILCLFMTACELKVGLSKSCHLSLTCFLRQSTIVKVLL